jgi:hypothetical protein
MKKKKKKKVEQPVRHYGYYRDPEESFLGGLKISYPAHHKSILQA